jgi:hypothetical protein
VDVPANWAHTEPCIGLVVLNLPRVPVMASKALPEVPPELAVLIVTPFEPPSKVFVFKAIRGT